MSFTIAVAGKGGVGKTTTCGLIIDYLCKQKKGPILAVDADANANLNEVLGVAAEMTLGDLREEIAKADLTDPSPIPPAMSKQDYLNFKFNSAMVETDDYDMIVMGRTQGSGCYCFVNGLLQHQLAKISDQYRYVVVDNEAGMEHISRGILPKVDLILLVSDCSRRGIQAVARIAALVKEVQMNVTTVKLIVNRAPEGELDTGIREEIEKHGLDLLGVLPHDPLVYEYDCTGRPMVQLPDDSPVRRKLAELLGQIDL